MTVYVVQQRGRSVVKIGYTSREVVSRIRRIGTLIDVPLDILLAFPGTRADELELHARFHEYRKHGEWFYVKGTLADWIASELERAGDWRDGVGAGASERERREHEEDEVERWRRHEEEVGRRTAEKRRKNTEWERGDRARKREDVLRHLHNGVIHPLWWHSIWEDAPDALRAEMVRLVKELTLQRQPHANVSWAEEFVARQHADEKVRPLRG